MQAVRWILVFLVWIVCLSSILSMAFIAIVLPAKSHAGVDWPWFAGHAIVAIAAGFLLAYLHGWRVSRGRRSAD